MFNNRWYLVLHSLISMNELTCRALCLLQVRTVSRDQVRALREAVHDVSIWVHYLKPFLSTDCLKAFSKPFLLKKPSHLNFHLLVWLFYRDLRQTQGQLNGRMEEMCFCILQRSNNEGCVKLCVEIGEPNKWIFLPWSIYM